jgi:hypothetical protein
MKHAQFYPKPAYVAEVINIQKSFNTERKVERCKKESQSDTEH